MVKDGAGGSKANQRAARKARLAAALRENLKRRKQQARQRVRAIAPNEPTSNEPTSSAPKLSEPKEPRDG
jgi:hypothetical protein